MTSLQSSMPSPGRISWRKDLSAIARDSNTQYLRVRHVVIRGTEVVEKPSPHVEYKIDIVTESNSWFVYKRYSQFHSLHFKLHKKFSLSWDLLPKKLVSGNFDPKNIATRKRQLEHYLQKLVNSDSSMAMCEELLHFLDVYYHDVVYVTRSLSSFVFKHGDAILSNHQLFQLSPTEVYCIGRRLKLPVETSPSDACDSSQDLGHLFSFVHQLHNLMIAPRPSIGHFGNVSFDLSVFKSLSYLVVRDVDVTLMEGLRSLQGQILDFRCHKCVSSLDDILVHPVSTHAAFPSHPPHTEPWRVEMTARLVQNKVVLHPWHFLERLDLSFNKIASVSQTLHLMPSLHTLSLSHNRLSQLDLHLFSFISLKEVDVSYNAINLIYRSKAPLPSVTSFNISHNRLQNLDSMDCLPSLAQLDFSHNMVHSLQEVDKVIRLDQLTRFNFSNNPISSQKNARISISAKFYVHNKPIILDGSEITEKEKYKIMANINKFGSNVQNWSNAVSHVSISSLVAPYWQSEQCLSRDHHRTLSFSLSSNLLLEDPRYEVSWSHFSSPTGDSQSPSITSSAISTPAGSTDSTPPLCNPLTPESPLGEVFIYSDSSRAQEMLLDPSGPHPDSPVAVSPDVLLDGLSTLAIQETADVSHTELEQSHTPMPSRGHTPIEPESMVVSKSALAHALATLNMRGTEQSLDESELTPKSVLHCFTAESVTAAILELNVSNSSVAGDHTPEDNCTMEQILLEDRIRGAIDSLLASPNVTELSVNMSGQLGTDSSQLRPHTIACAINERVMAEL